MSLIIKFSQNIFKNKSKRKRNFISIDYSKLEYLPDKKMYSNSNGKMLF